MSQKLNIALKGLQTNSNLLQVGDGALVSASNINIDRGVAESRRGFTTHSTEAGIDRITEYQNKLIAHHTDNTMSYYSGGSWTDFSSTYSHPDNKMNFLQASENLYFPTLTGINVLNAYNGTIYNTGMPKGLDGVGVTSGASGFMATNTQVAYRVVFGSRDDNNNLFLGAPSQRIIVSNTSGGTRDVDLTFTLPSGLTVNDFFQVYRSKESATSSTEPNDELQLCYEANPTAGEITAKSVTFTELRPSTMLEAFLYTNSSQEGISESNDIPPFAKDIALFKGFTFFANTKTKYYIDINLLACGGSNGLVADNTITINSMVFTAKAATTIASRQFKVFSAGSASQNIDDTARELVKVINQYTSNTTVYAYYTSGYGDIPGAIRIEERTLSSTAFTVSVSRATAWKLENSGTSANESNQNGLMWSKIQQPEHVPAPHLEFVGSKTYPIKRILALRDSLYILKTDGVFKLTGVNGVWSIEQLDASTVIIASDSAVVMNNQIFCLSNQGVVSISDVGVKVVSEQIKDSLTELIGLDYAALQSVTFGISYETDRKYILNTISAAGETKATQQFVFNVFTEQWSRWVKDAVHGFVANSNDKLYLSNTTSLLEERKNFNYTDYIDEAITGIAIASYTSTTVTLNTTSGLTVGDLLYLDSTTYSPITAINDASLTVTVYDSGKTWTPGAVIVYKGIDCQIEWAPQYCDNSGIEKGFEELAIMFKQKRFNTATMDFYTDVSGGWSSVSLTGDYGGGDWGMFAWGALPWGGEARGSSSRLRIPRNKSRGQYLGIRFSCRTAYAIFQVQGLSIMFDMVSERLTSGT